AAPRPGGRRGGVSGGRLQQLAAGGFELAAVVADRDAERLLDLGLVRGYRRHAAEAQQTEARVDRDRDLALARERQRRADERRVEQAAAVVAHQHAVDPAAERPQPALQLPQRAAAGG